MKSAAPWLQQAIDGSLLSRFYIYRWRIYRRRRKYAGKIFRHLFRDVDHSLNRAIVVAGAARSGTTWLANVLSAELRGRLLFEPFYPEMVPAYCTFDYFQFMDPEAEHPALRAFCAELFRGNIRDAWIDRYVERLRPRHRIVKAVRANLFLKWLHNSFPDVPFLFIVRHPCAVCLSRMELGWDPDPDLNRLLSLRSLKAGVLQHKMAIIRRAKTIAEKNAVLWCILNLVPLQQFGLEQLPLIFYEEMVTRPSEIFPAIFHHIGHDCDENAFSRINRPSFTSRENSAVVTGLNQLTVWKTALSEKQIASILAIVEGFGMDFLYGNSETPLISSTVSQAGAR